MMIVMIRKIINCLKPKELHGTYVKYSHSTACENPKMILAEYNRVYDDKIKEIKELKKSDYYVVINNVSIDGDLKSYETRYASCFFDEIDITLKQFKKTVYKKFNVKIHAKKLKEILDQYEKDMVKLERLNKELSDITDEMKEFEEDYKYILR